MIFTADFWVGAGERAIKTAAQTLGASLVVGAAVTSEPWLHAAELTGTAIVFSIITSIGSASFVAGRTGRTARKRAAA